MFGGGWSGGGGDWGGKGGKGGSRGGAGGSKPPDNAFKYFIPGLPLQVTSDQIKQHFMQFGDVKVAPCSPPPPPKARPGGAV